MIKKRVLPGIVCLSLLALSFACSSEKGRTGVDDGRSVDGSGATGNGTGGGIDIGDGSGGTDGIVLENPTDCASAASAGSYVGCEFWPTVVANPVWKEFDFAIVVANGGDKEADITVEGPNGFEKTDKVPAGGLTTVLLPWVDELKGPEFDLPKTTGGRLKTSLSMKKGAYHMTSSVPVTTWQFSPLQYRKDMGTGPGQCGARIQAAVPAEATECRAASNDASLLLPTTAMTGNYRIAAYSGARGDDNWGGTPSGMAITATQDGTSVDVQLSPFCSADYLGDDNGCVIAGGDVPKAIHDEVLHFDMNAGDVIELQAEYGPWPQVEHADLSGSVINANKPVQAIAFNAEVMVPDETSNPDHLEETVLPAEVIGKKYIVVPPSAYGGTPRGHLVRFYGNVDGTKLKYPEGKPPGAPDTIDAGQVVQMPTPEPSHQCAAANDSCYVSTPFVVEGDQPFVVASFMVGGKLQAPGWPETYGEPGDPAFSMMVTPEQFRKKYTFLAPADFTENWADILVPDGATATLDGAPLSAGTAIGASGWSIVRMKLSGEGGGIHDLETDDDRGVGLQVMGFGSATSYYYPGGLNLKHISDPPIIK